MRRNQGRWLAAASLLLAAGGAARAQNTQDLNNYSLPPAQITPAPTPGPSALPTVAPLPTPTSSAPPTAAAPTPRAIPTPTPTLRSTPTPTPSAATPSAQPTAPRTITPAPTPSPSATPRLDVQAPRAAPAATPAPVPLPTTTPTPEPTAVPPVAIDTGTGVLGTWIALGCVGMLALAALIWFLRRRDRPEERAFYDLSAPDDAPAPEPPAPAGVAPPEPTASQPVATTAIAPRAEIKLAIHPRRAGLNLLSATAEVEVELVNTGALAGEDIAVDVKLFGARSGPDELLARHFAEPIARPVTARFALASDERRMVRAVAALPRDAMEPLVAGGRPMFVPVVAVNVLYRWAAGDAAEGRGQSAAAWVVGITREGTDKLAPFWLDVQPRMHEELGAREHGLAVRQ